MRLALGLKAAEAEEEGLAAAVMAVDMEMDIGVDMGVVKEEMTEEEAVEEVTGKVAENREVGVNAPGEWCRHNRPIIELRLTRELVEKLPKY